MPLLPIATFLAGAILSLLIPILLLIGLTVWYVMYVRRVPETPEGAKPGLPDPSLGTPGEPAKPAAEGP